MLRLTVKIADVVEHRPRRDQDREPFAEQVTPALYAFIGHFGTHE